MMLGRSVVLGRRFEVEDLRPLGIKCGACLRNHFIE